MYSKSWIFYFITTDVLINEDLYLSDSSSNGEGGESDHGEFDWRKDKNRCNVEDDEAKSENIKHSCLNGQGNDEPNKLRTDNNNFTTTGSIKLTDVSIDYQLKFNKNILIFWS